MPKTEAASGLDSIQESVVAFLKSAGFKKSGRTFNRPATDGIIQVVNLQMGTYPIGRYEVPGIRESLYGKFTVNLGVLLPCVNEIYPWRLNKKFAVESACQIRERLGALAHEGRDAWWSIQPPFEPISAEICELLGSLGLPFLEMFGSYRAVLGYYETHGVFPGQIEGRSSLEAALVYRALGDTEHSREAFDKAKRFAEENKNPGFLAKIREVETRTSR